MTRTELLHIANMAHQPTGVAYLDDIFKVVDSAIYYRLLYHYVKITQPDLVVELGTERGRGTAHMAEAGPKTLIVTVDPNPLNELQEVLQRYPNIDWRADVSTSLTVLDSIADGSVQLCFVDTSHSIEQVLAEYRAWLPKIKIGGVMLFDDISENESMVRAWEKLRTLAAPFELVEMPDLHHSGFGAILL